MPARAATTSELLTRGTLAARAACSIETIRYYERIGILPPPPRSQGGHRLYGHDLIKRLTFVRRSRELGFTLEEIRQLLRLVDGAKYSCAQIETMALRHAHDLRQKIADLKKLKSVLEAMASQCSGGQVPECPIIDELFGAQMSLPSAKAHASASSTRARAIKRHRPAGTIAAHRTGSR